MSIPPKNESHIAWLKDQLAVWEERLREAQVAAAEVANCKEHIRLLKTSLATAEGTPPESSTASNPHKYARMRLPEAIMDYLEEHRYPVDIVKELIPALIAGGAMTGRRKPDAPLKDNLYPLRAVMVTMYTLAKDAKVTLNKKTRVVEIR